MPTGRYPSADASWTMWPSEIAVFMIAPVAGSGQYTLVASFAMVFRIGPEISIRGELPGGSSSIAIVAPDNVVHTISAPLTATWLMDAWPDTSTSVAWPSDATVRMSEPADQ